MIALKALGILNEAVSVWDCFCIAKQMQYRVSCFPGVVFEGLVKLGVSFAVLEVVHDCFWHATVLTECRVSA